MLSKLDLSRTRVALAAAAATLTIGGFAVAWADASSPPATTQLASSSEAPGDVSGPCDEAENASKPECGGGVPLEGGTIDDSTSTTPSTADASVIPGSGAASAPSAGEIRSFAAADAGSVSYTVDGATLQLIDAVPAAGWRVEIEQAGGSEIDLDFRSGTRRVQVDVEFEDGGVRERVRVRDDADGSRVEITNGAVSRVEDDDDRRDDDSRLGSADDDRQEDHDDRSGTGHGDDDDDDDRSGHGGDDDRDDDSGGHGSDD